MRFPATSPPKQLLRRAAVIEPIRPPVTDRAPQPQAAPLRPVRLPAALDERVRLVGEW